MTGPRRSLRQAVGVVAVHSSDFRPRQRIVDRAAVERFRLEMLGEMCEVCEIRFGQHVHHVKFRSRGGDDVPVDEQGRRQFLWVCPVCDADHGNLPSISRYG